MIYCYGFRVAMCIEVRARVRSLMFKDKLETSFFDGDGLIRGISSGRWV
jgi:hypothetical protein